MDVHIFVGAFLTISFVAVVWATTRITTRLIKARVCTSKLEYRRHLLEFERKRHQDMMFMRREQMEKMSIPFSGLGPRNKNDDPDQQH